MKTTNAYLLTLVSTLLFAPAFSSESDISAQAASDPASQSEHGAISVAQMPLVLSDFDLSAVRIRATAEASADSGAITASLVGPRRVSLPRAGGTTLVPLNVQGLSTSVQPIALPAGIAVSMSGNQLSVVATANRSTLERTGSIAVLVQSPIVASRGKVRGVLQIGLSQLPCTTKTCPTTAPASTATVTQTVAPLQPTGIDWTAIAGELTRTSSNSVLVAIDGNDSTTRTSGAALQRLTQVCAVNAVKCILELRSQPGSSLAAASEYFLSPDVLAALHGTEAQLLLSLRGNEPLEGSLGAVSQLRAAGLGHTLLVSARPDAAQLLASDSDHDLLFASDGASNQAATVPSVVVPQAIIVSAPLGPVDFEINDQAFLVDRSLAAFNAAGGSVALRFLQTGGLRWAIRKVPNSFVQGGAQFPQSGNVTLTVGPSSTPRSEHVEFSARTADGGITLFIEVAVIQDPTGTAF